MERHFSVPKIPIVKVPAVRQQQSSVLKSISNSNTTSGRQTSSHAQDRSTSSPATNGYVDDNDSDRRRQRQTTTTTTSASEKALPVTSSSSSSRQAAPAQQLFPLVLPGNMPALCPPCSRILIDYLAPIERYIKNVLQAAESKIEIPARPSTGPAEIEVVKNVRALQVDPGTGKDFPLASRGGENTAELPNRPKQFDSNDLSLSDNSIQYNIDDQNDHHHRYPSGRSETRASEPVEDKKNNAGTRNCRVEKYKDSDEARVLANVFSTSSSSSPSKDSSSFIKNASTHSRENSPQSFKSNSSDSVQNSCESKHDREILYSSPQNCGTNNNTVQGKNQEEEEYSETNNNNKNSSNNNENYSQSISVEEGIHRSETSEIDDNGPEGPRSPYAYATIVVDNLSALNAILLLNSLHFNNNHHLVITGNEVSSTKEDCKRIVARYYIPAIVFVDGPIAAELLEILASIYDQIIQLNTTESRLLDSEQYGIVHRKMHLWAQLAGTFDKCIFLDPTILVVGTISNLFVECGELSACVDCFYPDHLNCSLFLFEPSEQTFRAMLQFGLKEKSRCEGDFEVGDESALLNGYFASKWNRLSFVYNFCRADHTYTQIPAYLKFGGHVRVVNFQLSADQPWNIKFNLVRAASEENPLESLSSSSSSSSPSSLWVDNYSKFYLRLFMCRVWPLISKVLTARILANHRHRHEWTVCELLHMLDPSSNSRAWQYNPITTRRKTPTTAEKFPNESSLPQWSGATLPSLADSPLAYSRDSLEMNIHDVDQTDKGSLYSGSNNSTNHDIHKPDNHHHHDHHGDRRQSATESQMSSIIAETKDGENSNQNIEPKPESSEGDLKRDGNSRISVNPDSDRNSQHVGSSGIVSTVEPLTGTASGQMAVTIEQTSSDPRRLPSRSAGGQWSGESMDWLGESQSDQIINRLKSLFRN